ncbi:MAG: low molecular weight phosphotyrosine protein phosphatase [Armatimonadota bacterium]|nr:low molecular weight phosphotyrosine protein phosphatase [Armatimonadota bacterium]
MIRVLFVCLGNICRSPMAEAVFMHKVRAEGLSDQIEADSAGTGAWHIGKPPHPGTCQVLEANGISYSHRGRQLKEKDLKTFHYVVVMDEWNFKDVKRFRPGSAKVVRLLEYAPQTGVEDVPDPFNTGGFEGVYALIDAATTGLLQAVCEEHSLVAVGAAAARVQS